MMFLKKILATIVSLSFALPLFSAHHSHDDSHHHNDCHPNCHFSDDALPGSRFSRTVVIAQNTVWGGPTIPLDPNHQLAISSGLYTADQAEAITTDSIAELNAKFGIDFSTVVPDANGIRIIPGIGISFPAINGLDELNVVIVDTKHPSRAKSHRWFNVDVTQLATFTSSFIAPGGTFAGTQIQAGDLYVYGDENFLKSDSDWSCAENREVLKLSTSLLSKQAINQYGNREFIFSYNVEDAHRHEGQSIGSTIINPIDGINILQSHNLLIWNCPVEVVQPV